MLVRFPPRRILVATDFSPPSKSAVKLAMALGRFFDSELEIIHVLEPDAVPGENPVGVAQAKREQFQRLPELRVSLRELAADYSGTVRVKALVGSARAILSRLARPRNADLLVMGTHGYQGFERLAYGSTAEALIAESAIPLLTTHQRRSRFALERILCPVNLTPYAATALSYAALFSQSTHATLDALYVHPKDVWAEDARKLINSFLQETLGASSHLVRPDVCRGEAREQIGLAAKRGGYDLVVLSAHRRPWSSDTLAGTTAQRLARFSPVPILSVPVRGMAADLSERMMVSRLHPL